MVQHSGQSGRVQFLVNHDITFLSDASSYGTCVYFQGCHRACRVRNHWGWVLSLLGKCCRVNGSIRFGGHHCGAILFMIQFNAKNEILMCKKWNFRDLHKLESWFMYTSRISCKEMTEANLHGLPTCPSCLHRLWSLMRYVYNPSSCILTWVVKNACLHQL